MRYIKTTKVEHLLECDGEELLQFYQGELRLSDGEIMDPEDERVEVTAIMPSGGDYSGMLLPIKDLKFSVAWTEEDETVEED